jgi:cyclopropane fatty-acyl-phospholipid synthase-like methyltransferase
VTTEYFDGWFADIARSQVRQALFTEHLGLPPEVGPSNMVPLDGLRELAVSLKLGPGSALVDLGCGRGGPGMWIARETGARLVGVDFSAEAVAQAMARRSLFGLVDRASFVVGTLDTTGLSAGSADAVVCVDAVQFSTDGVATVQEVRRILRSGGRVALTTWEAVDRFDPEVSERLRAVDVPGWLTAAGFVDVVVAERPVWHATSLRLWQDAVSRDADGDPAVESMQEEGARSIAHHNKLHRLMATAAAP